ncbi:uncharacterized protein LOC116187049 isoform X4 [Punica granatum]|uniref:Uncharacterized protein LOC116187049 isoform X4 n=1 Tax=Punica granatum TaxID=22663 RepID=A0A218WGT1_PUNGR|nr:uncharacterized protein LOC116187049 isoform X4 [Punica granatum]OWM72064.1 hypothetical protein CDL15_Pgr017947 [Punica granatum]
MMLEASGLLPSRVLSPSREESGDEDLHVLPRHTKVIVTGNNRTKSVLVGLQGVVKKAVGLGGWHWLVLKNGIEVKLQRNALSVLEHPTGNEEDGDHDFDSSSSSEIGGKEHQYSTDIDFHKVRKPKVRYTRPWMTSSSVAKSVNQGSYRDVRSLIAPKSSVNLAKLGTKALWRYCKHYKLVTSNSNASREQMLSSVRRHFASQRLNEKKVIVDFIRAAKKLKRENKEKHV